MKLRGKVFSGRWLKKFWAKSFGKSLFGRVDSGEWVEMTSPSPDSKICCSEPQLWTTEFDGRQGKRCSGGFYRGRRLPLQSAVEQSAARAATDILSNELSCRDPSTSGCKRRGCGNGFCWRCRVPLQSTEVQAAAAEYRGAVCRCRVPKCRMLLQSTELQGVVCATMDPAEGAWCFCWMLSHSAWAAHSQDFGEFDFIDLLSTFNSRNIRLESLHVKFCFFKITSNWQVK